MPTGRQPRPITFSCVFGGEDYDARLEPADWNQRDSKAPVGHGSGDDGPGGELRGLSHAAPRFAHSTCSTGGNQAVRPGVTVYDLVKNASLMPRFTVQGASGSTVRIIPAELIAAMARLTASPSVAVKPTGNTRWGAADGENWFPKFFYHGARYLQVECSAPVRGGGLPVVKTIEGVVVHTASPSVGDFETSNELFNRIRTLIRWAQRSNLVSLITDVPTANAWAGSNNIISTVLRCGTNRPCRALYENFDDMADAQLDNGLVPDIAPEYVVFSGGFRDSPSGEALSSGRLAAVSLHGDTVAFRRHYDG